MSFLTYGDLNARKKGIVDINLNMHGADFSQILSLEQFRSNLYIRLHYKQFGSQSHICFVCSVLNV